MKAGKKIAKRLEDRIAGHEKTVARLGADKAKGYRRPGARKK